MDNFWSEIKKAMFDREETGSYIPYRDSSGTLLRPDEILFTDERTFCGKQHFDVWGSEEKEVKGETIYSEGVTPLYDESGNFPIALQSADGSLKYMKISKVTGEVLPIHAGCCPVLNMNFVGPPSSGKTVHVLQLSDPVFHNMIAKGTSCSIEDDIPSQAPKRKKYEESRARFKKHILPAPNKLGEVILPYVYYVQYGEGTEKRRVLLKIEDIDGQQCTDMEWESKLYYSDCFVLTIGADELVGKSEDLENGVEEAQYERVVNQLLPRLRVLRRDRDFVVIVVITKSDLLDKKDPCLKDAFENSVQFKDGKWTQLIHEKGFNWDHFEKREEAVEGYLRNECCNLYNKLINAVPRNNLTFCMIASVGEKGEWVEIDGKSQYHFQDYQPFCVDEPLLSIMASAGVYPSCGEIKPMGEPVPGYPKFFQGGWMRKWKEILRMMEEEYDDDEEDADAY